MLLIWQVDPCRSLQLAAAMGSPCPVVELFRSRGCNPFLSALAIRQAQPVPELHKGLPGSGLHAIRPSLWGFPILPALLLSEDCSPHPALVIPDPFHCCWSALATLLNSQPSAHDSIDSCNSRLDLSLSSPSPENLSSPGLLESAILIKSLLQRDLV